ncbi:MAG: hypothetical protein WBW88_11490, partial [Rhodothermales bacterium]
PNTKHQIPNFGADRRMSRGLTSNIKLQTANFRGGIRGGIGSHQIRTFNARFRHSLATRLAVNNRTPPSESRRPKLMFAVCCLLFDVWYLVFGIWY